ncbi:LacI family DNA-binding transcriptional regulator [Alphaproteobacteria bacterium]|nr:LacI family DNA-binding transcriptional regulator [Alphaproteobacteria bacterium]
MPTYSAPTLTDVAKKAGVSTATVSRCLNTPDRVAKRTRDKVEDAIAELGYTPNFGARVMASKRTYTIGAIIPTMENAIFARGLQAFQDELRNQGYTLLVASSSYDPKIEEEQIYTLTSRGVDGLLLIGHDRSSEIIDYLEEKNIPTIVAWAHDPNSRLPSVGFDNFAAMSELARYVLSLGHRRIGMISSWTKSNDRARERVNAVRHVMLKSLGSKNELILLETDYGIETGAEAFGKIINRSYPPTVIICGNDVLAAGALKKASMLGLSVPRDVSFTGFDDIDLAYLTTPALTTVHIPHREMGTNAARALLAITRDRNFRILEELKPSLVIRSSLEKPANSH